MRAARAALNVACATLGAHGAEGINVQVKRRDVPRSAKFLVQIPKMRFYLQIAGNSAQLRSQ